MPNEVIDRVNRMADEANAEAELTFEYRDGRPTGVDVDDELSDDDETYYDEDYRSDDEEEYQNEGYETWDNEDNRYIGHRFTGVDDKAYEEVPERAESEVSDDESRSDCDLKDD